jgi:hypothetical protein
MLKQNLVESKYILSYKIWTFLLYSPGMAVQQPNAGSHNIYYIVVNNKAKKVQ